MCFLIFIQSSTIDWYLEVKIWARDTQCSSCPLIPETKNIKILNTLTSLYHVEHDTCTVLGRNIKTRYFGLILILRLKRIDILSDSIECNYSPRNTSSLLYSKSCEIENWRSLVWEIIHVSSTTTKEHDHDWTRGNDKLGSTVEQQPVGKLVRQSCGEVQHEAFSQPTQPKPKPICDRSGKPDSTEDVFVVKSETSRSHEIDEKVLHEELGSSDRSGKPEKLSENIRVKQAHDRTRQPDERNSSSVHTVKEQFAPEENRDIALFNTDNEFNNAINEKNIDFNIPGVPHSTVKRSHGVNVRNLIQKIENHPQRHALQSDLQQRRPFNDNEQRITRHD